MAQIVQPLKLPLTEVDLVQSCLLLFLHHPQPLPVAVRLLQQKTHIGFHLVGGKADIVQRHDGTEPLQILVIVLPRTHHLFHHAAQSPAFIFVQNVGWDTVAAAGFFLCQSPRS